MSSRSGALSLDKVRIRHRLFEIRCKAWFRGWRRIGAHGHETGPGRLDGAVQRPFGPGIGIVDNDVIPGRQETRGPAGADEAPADTGDTPDIRGIGAIESQGESVPLLLAATKASGLLAQGEFLDLAGRRLGQGPEDHGSRRLEVGEVVTAKGDDVGLRHGLRRIVLESDTRHRVIRPRSRPASPRPPLPAR